MDRSLAVSFGSETDGLECWRLGAVLASNVNRKGAAAAAGPADLIIATLLRRASPQTTGGRSTAEMSS